MGEKTNNQRQTLGADAIRNLRLRIWRKWEAMLDKALSPSFSGKITIELSTENGKPSGKAVANLREYLDEDD
jgi:hypothetical protein